MGILCGLMYVGEETGAVTFSDILKELSHSVKDLKLPFYDIELQVYDHLVPGLRPWGSLHWIGFAKCTQLAPWFFVDLAYLFKSYRAKKMKVIVTHYIVEREEYTEYSDRD